MSVTTLNGRKYDRDYSQWKKKNMSTVATPNGRRRIQSLPVCAAPQQWPAPEGRRTWAPEWGSSTEQSPRSDTRVPLDALAQTAPETDTRLQHPSRQHHHNQLVKRAQEMRFKSILTHDYMTLTASHSPNQKHKCFSIRPNTFPCGFYFSHLVVLVKNGLFERFVRDYTKHNTETDTVAVRGTETYTRAIKNPEQHTLDWKTNEPQNMSRNIYDRTNFSILAC